MGWPPSTHGKIVVISLLLMSKKSICDCPSDHEVCQQKSVAAAGCQPGPLATAAAVVSHLLQTTAAIKGADALPRGNQTCVLWQLSGLNVRNFARNSLCLEFIAMLLFVHTLQGAKPSLSNMPADG
jgi:hypothetical protein